MIEFNWQAHQKQIVLGLLGLLITWAISFLDSIF